MKNYKFSIVTSFYNNEKNHINDLYNSVINQTYNNFEWIITDDFSQDNTKEIISKFNDDRIKYIEQKFKKEIFYNPQTYANGDIVVQVDSDDIIYPKALEIYNHFFNLYPDVLFMTSNTNYFDHKNNFIDNHIIYHGDYNNCLDKKKDKDYNYQKYRSKNFLKINGAWGNLHAWRNIDINFNEDNRDIVYMDKYRSLKLEEYGKYLHIPRTLYRNNIIPGSICHQNKQYIEDDKYFNLIKQKRIKDIISYVKIYDFIFNESQPFLYSDLNFEKTSQNISFNTQNDIDINKQKLLNEIYYDHNLFFNKIDDSIDYYFFMLDDKKYYFGNNEDDFIESCKQLNIQDKILNEYVHYIKDVINNKKYKEVVIQKTPNLEILKPIGLNIIFDGEYNEYDGFEIIKIKK